jgi:hypothetical protein
MLVRFLIVACLAFTCILDNSFGKDISIRLEDGSLMLADFLDACEEAAECTPSKRVPANLAGKIITIKDIPYEVRFFSFEDTSGKLSADIPFKDYVKQNNLLALRSIAVKPLPGIHFESFDFRKNPKNDGIYFSMALRKIENGDN